MGVLSQIISGVVLIRRHINFEQSDRPTYDRARFGLGTGAIIAAIANGYFMGPIDRVPAI